MTGNFPFCTVLIFRQFSFFAAFQFDEFSEMANWAAIGSGVTDDRLNSAEARDPFG
jgi:hypothetical protein